MPRAWARKMPIVLFPQPAGPVTIQMFRCPLDGFLEVHCEEFSATLLEMAEVQEEDIVGATISFCMVVGGKKDGRTRKQQVMELACSL